MIRVSARVRVTVRFQVRSGQGLQLDAGMLITRIRLYRGPDQGKRQVRVRVRVRNPPKAGFGLPEVGLGFSLGIGIGLGLGIGIRLGIRLGLELGIAYGYGHG